MNFGAEQKQQLVARALMATLAVFVGVQIFSHSTFAQNQREGIKPPLAMAQATTTSGQARSAPPPLAPLPGATQAGQAPSAQPPSPPAMPSYGPPPGFRPGPPPGNMPPPPGAYGPPPGNMQQAYDSDREPFHHRFMPPFMAPFMPPPGEDTYAGGPEGHRHHGGGNLFGFPHFRHFVNRQVSYTPAFLLLLAMSSLFWMLVPHKMDEGVSCIREQFWKSLALGILTMGIGMPVVHCLFFSGVGIPLAQFTLGLLQLGLVAGFAVIAAVVGTTLINRVGAGKFLENHPLEARYLSIAIGVAVICLLFLVPAIGVLARVGNRLVMLNAILGLGSLVNARVSSNKSG